MNIQKLSVASLIPNEPFVLLEDDKRYEGVSEESFGDLAKRIGEHNLFGITKNGGKVSYSVARLQTKNKINPVTQNDIQRARTAIESFVRAAETARNAYYDRYAQPVNKLIGKKIFELSADEINQINRLKLYAGDTSVNIDSSGEIIEVINVSRFPIVYPFLLRRELLYTVGTDNRKAFDKFVAGVK
jgi:hypothetical protein